MLSININTSEFVCGDMNCAGTDQHAVENTLDLVFSSVNISQFVDSPTCGEDLLDVLACSTDPPWVKEVRIDDGGNVFDHRLVRADLAVGNVGLRLLINFDPLRILIMRYLSRVSDYYYCSLPRLNLLRLSLNRCFRL